MQRLSLLAGWIVLLLLALALPLAAVAQQALPIQWPQSSISWTQLQNLFSSYPGVNRFNIQFPNSANWNVEVNQMQSLYANYSQQAQNLGYGTKYKMPNLSFSSLPGKGSFGAGSVTVPIENAMTNMQLQADNSLRQMRQQMNASSWMPGWLSRGVTHFQDNASAAYFALPAWFRSGLESLWGYIVAGGSFIYNKLVSLMR